MGEHLQKLPDDIVVDLAGWPRAAPALETRPEDFFPRTDKIVDPYPEQIPALRFSRDFLADPAMRILVDLLPPASGKTPLSVARALAWNAAGGQTLLIAPTKDLQQNLVRDVVQGTINVVYGGVEFKCLGKEGVTCGSDWARRNCSSRKIRRASNTGACESACPYNATRIAAAEGARKKPICATPHSFMALKRHPIFSEGLPQGNGLMIVDEAHLLPAQLREFLTISFQTDFVERILRMPRGAVKLDFFSDAVATNDAHLPVTLLDAMVGGDKGRSASAIRRAYLEAVSETCARLRSELTSALEANRMDALAEFDDLVDAEDEEPNRGLIERLADLKEKVDSVIATSKETHWVVEALPAPRRRDGLTPTDETPAYRIQLSPTIIPKSFLRRFFGGFSKVILMSGTLYPIHLKQLGLVGDDEEGIAQLSRFEMPSRIDPARRRIHVDLITGVAVNRNNLNESFTSFAQWALRVARRLPGEKGMIHVSSHAQVELAARKCREAAQKASHQRGRRGVPEAIFITPTELGWKATLREFRAARPRPDQMIFLIAARRYEGIDLADDEARAVLFAKVPSPNRANTMVRVLEAVYPGYYDTETLTALLQGCHRGTRHPKDWSFIGVFDKNVKFLLERHGTTLPEYHQEAFEIVEEIDWIETWVIPEYRSPKKPAKAPERPE